MNIDNPLSFFCITSQLLHQYELPDINTLAKNQPTKLSWKHAAREAVRKYWLKILLEDIENKSTLVNLQKDHLKFGSTHQVWDSLQSTKKIAPSGGRRENFWGISCEKSRFYAKKSYFFKF
jgi:hypothetical protein